MEELVPEVVISDEERKFVEDRSRPTRVRLVEALKESNMPKWMIIDAELGKYDFEGRTKLCVDLKNRRTEASMVMLKRIAEGEFNHTNIDLFMDIQKSQRAGNQPVKRGVPQPNRKQRRLNSKIQRLQWKKASKQTGVA